jgi:hypothetical protein
MGQLACKTAAGQAVAEVAAAQWKARLALRGCGKDDSRALAAQLLPERADDVRCAAAMPRPRCWLVLVVSDGE